MNNAMHPFVAVILVFMTSAAVAASQIDTSFFKDLPPDEELRKAGMATRADMLKTKREMKGLMHGMDSGWKASRENMRETAHLSSGEEDDGPIPQTLEEKILNPSGVYLLLIDLQKHPISKLPEGFDNLTDLQFLVIGNLPEGGRFDFEDAFNQIAKISSVRDLCVINNGKGLRAIPASIAEMTELKRLVLYNNAITGAECAALQAKLPDCSITCTTTR